MRKRRKRQKRSYFTKSILPHYQKKTRSVLKWFSPKEANIPDRKGIQYSHKRRHTYYSGCGYECFQNWQWKLTLANHIKDFTALLQFIGRY